MRQIPVYRFTGFLESGKTKFIQETLEDERFNACEITLLLVMEEGEEELFDAELCGAEVLFDALSEDGLVAEDV